MTDIINPQATPEPENATICAYSGFRIRDGDEVRRTWDGHLVLARFWEPRHPQDFVRARPDTRETPSQGMLRPDDQFVPPVPTIPYEQRVAVIYNSDREASRQIADYVCTKYNIPIGNKLGLAMGTGWRWTYTAGRYTDIAATAAHFERINAQGLVLCEGSPNRMDFPKDIDPGDTDQGFDTARVLAMSKRIVARFRGEEPRYTEDNTPPPAYFYTQDTLVYPEGDGLWTTDPNTYDRADALFAQLEWRGKVDASAKGYETSPVGMELDVYRPYMLWKFDPVMESYRGAWTGLGNSVGGGTASRWVPRITAAFNGDHGWFSMLPYGRIGLPKFTQDDTFDPDLYTKSVAIIDRADALNKTLGQAKASTRIFFPFSYVGLKTEPYCLAQQALPYRYAADAGFGNLTYWYSDGGDARTWDQIAIGMAPPAGGLSWTESQLDAGTATPQTFDICIGGMENGTGSTLTDAKIDAWCSTANGFVPAATGVLLMGGASYFYQWVQRAVTLDRFAAAYCNPYNNGGGWHHTAEQCRIATAVFLDMLERGTTLLEASALGFESAHYPMGNPLVRPFAAP